MKGTRMQAFFMSAVVACAAGCGGSAPPPDNAPPVDNPAQTTPGPDPAATLVAYRWQLETATDGQGQPIAALAPSADRTLGIEFVDSGIGVNGGCNRLRVGYVLKGADQLELSRGAQTLMACPPPLAAIDAAFTAFLTGTVTFALDGVSPTPRLQLTAADGGTMAFLGEPTPETRFGGPGTRAFLEISADPCPPEAASTSGCLMVRDRQFDEQGLPAGTPGEWRPLPGGIEGYTPAPDADQVVRVKRFEQAGAAGGAPTVHYVFDMVVETRTRN